MVKTKKPSASKGSLGHRDDSDDDESDSKSTCALSSETLMVIDRICTTFTHVFNSCVDRIVDTIEKKLSQRLDHHSSDLFDAAKRIDHLEKANTDLLAEINSVKDLNKSLSSKLDTLNTHVDDLEPYSRNTSILVHGLPVVAAAHGPESDLPERVITVVNSHLGLTLTTGDIAVTHRIARVNQN